MAPAGHDALAAVALGWMAGLSDKWKLTLTIAAIFVAGTTAGVALVNFQGVPARVTTLERQAEANDSMHIALDGRLRNVEYDAAADRLRIEQKIDRVICLQEAAAGRVEYASCAR